MPSMLRGLLTAGLIAIFISLGTAASAQAGSVRIVRGTDVANDAVTHAPTVADVWFMRGRYWRMRAFSPYFDARLWWAPGSWVHQHAYGLDAGDLAAHPEWQLKDATNTPLYVGSRAAADFGNADFRAWWIAKAQAAVAAGYRGLFIDDVFMERRTTTAGGVSRTAIDPRTGVAFTEAGWQQQMADFMEAVRAALPNAEIVHDVLWYKGDSGAVLRGLQAANHVALDGGFNWSSLTYGSGTYGFQTLAAWVERAQARGGAVIFDFATASAAPRLFGLAAYLLVSNGSSAILNDASSAPGAFWGGYDVDLGTPVTGRYLATTGIFRRDFQKGIVLANEPYRSTRSVNVPAGYQDLDGVKRTKVTLAGGQGMVLVPAPVAPAPTATPTPTPVAPAETPVPVAPAPVAPTPGAPEAPPAKITTISTGGDGARIARAGGTAGARTPGSTRVSVRGSRRRLTGRVKGAVAGHVRVTIERKRGAKWAVVRRVKVAVKRNGRFTKDIPTLPRGSYRVSGFFEGTGTAKPARSGYSTF